MATIYDLPIKDISKMSDEELQAHIRGVRSRRTIPVAEVKEAAIKKSRAKKNKTVALQSIDSLIGDMTPEQARKALEFIEEKRK